MKTGVIKGLGYAVAGSVAMVTAAGVLVAPTYAEECPFSYNDTCYEDFVNAYNAVRTAGSGTIVLNSDFVMSEVTSKAYGINGDVTIDLNGHKISHNYFPFNIVATGKLTVKDSVGTGSIEADYPIYINGGTLVLESGTLVGTGSQVVNNVKGTFTMNGGKISGATYGVGLFDGGTAVVNAGEITSAYAALSGNNTQGDMNVYIKGGTVTATSNVAVYMPSQVTLDISGGTINGGVLLRMGQVSISGGTINSSSSTMALTAITPKNIPAYAYSGMMNLPNAITVMGGAYTSNNATYGNSLDMKITGGNIKSKNGSAVAVYDLGKVNQKISTTVTGGVFTSAAGKDAVVFQTLRQAGIEPISGYGVVENTLPSAMITGGTYSTEPSAEYIAEGYEAREDGNMLTVMTKETTFTETVAENGAIIDFGEGYALDRDAKLVIDDVTNDDILLLNGNIKKALDIHIEDENGDELSVENANLTISVPLENDLLGYDHYVVYYINDNGEIAETHEATVTNGVLTFMTNHLSAYAIAAYNDETETVTSDGATLASVTTKTSTNPNTGDNIANYFLVSGAAIVVMFGAIAYLMKREA